MCSVIRKIQRLMNRFTISMKVYYIYLKDAKYYLKHSITLNVNTRDKLGATILLLIHSLEKGMSFDIKKEGFGGGKAISLIESLERYLIKYDSDEISNLGFSVLNKYFKDEYSSKSRILLSKFNKVIEKNSHVIGNEGGVVKVSSPSLRFSYSDFYDFYASRRSVRCFSDKEITKDQINNAVELAKLTPTACNRQTSQVYYYKDKSIISEVLQDQLGDQGWCHKAETLFVITGNQSYFGGIYERNQLFVDGGLFSMNFIMGLHIQKIATCFKMYIRDPEKDEKLRNRINIPKNEIPIVLILAGHYLDYETTTPESVRF